MVILLSQKAPKSPSEKPYFSKIITVDRKTASIIPVDRSCLGHVLNHHNRHTRCLKLNLGIYKVKTNENVQKIPHSLYILGIPLSNHG